MNHYVTLFDSNYLDKGLVLYDSLVKAEGDNCRIYVVAFDDLCFDILTKEERKQLVPIRLADFETTELLKVKKERSRAEYCWTCTPWTIKYVFDTYKPEMCTYIDADMMFYASPNYLFEDMRKKNCSVLITPHFFSQSRSNQKKMNHVGTYCVEFNTFFNNSEGREALDWWAEQCLKWCFYAPPGADQWYGDQKYLNVFPNKFNGVYVSEERGAGLAFWNAGQYLYSNENGEPRIYYPKEQKSFKLIFAHFASVTFLTPHLVNIFSGIRDKKLHSVVCDPYITAIRDMRGYLEEKYGVVFFKRRKVTKNRFRAFLQMYVIPIWHIRRLSDLYRM